VNVRLIELERDALGRRYPIGRTLPPDQRKQAILVAHRLVHGQNRSIKAAQLALAEDFGIRRSRGQIWNDLHNFECRECRDGPD
jgi:hypothetical protein